VSFHTSCGSTRWILKQPQRRIYLAKDGDTLIVLLAGGTKRGQQADIDKAKGLLAEYKARKAALAKRKK